jgi:hypothetical protein
MWDAFRDAYGDRWNYFMPPVGRPVSFVENSGALNTFPQKNEASQALFRSFPIKVQSTEVLVITRYSCIASAAVVNPFWPGRLPTPLPPTAFQGRFAWTVMMGQGGQEDKSLIGDAPYQNTTPFPAGTVQYGKSLLQEYGTGNGDAPIIVPPGASVYLSVFAFPDDRGAEPPPPDSPQILITTELGGYRVPIPAAYNQRFGGTPRSQMGG